MLAHLYFFFPELGGGSPVPPAPGGHYVDAPWWRYSRKPKAKAERRRLRDDIERSFAALVPAERVPAVVRQAIALQDEPELLDALYRSLQDDEEIIVIALSL